MEQNIILETKNVSMAYPAEGGKSFFALRDVSIEIERGKLTVLVGKSGSGKTTLMNIIGAIDMPTDGQVMLEGEDITAMSEAERCRLRREKMGFVFQSVALIPLMTAEENAMFSLRLAGVTDGIEERAAECLRMVGLSKRASHMPQELSGGEQQRVAIARAIAHRPAILFADEPTAELDSSTAMQVARIFRDLVDKDGMTVMLTTHDRDLAGIGDKIYTLEDGELVETD